MSISMSFSSGSLFEGIEKDSTFHISGTVTASSGQIKRSSSFDVEFAISETKKRIRETDQNGPEPKRARIHLELATPKSDPENTTFLDVRNIIPDGVKRTRKTKQPKVDLAPNKNELIENYVHRKIIQQEYPHTFSDVNYSAISFEDLKFNPYS